jgi:hypothetical protein
MTSAVAGILQSIEGLSLPEQQELMVALCAVDSGSSVTGEASIPRP